MSAGKVADVVIILISTNVDKRDVVYPAITYVIDKGEGSIRVISNLFLYLSLNVRLVYFV